MIELAREAVDGATRAGAAYADARFVVEDTESLTVRNEETEAIDRATSSGVGIRVLSGGSWGFAATVRTDPEDVERTAALAVEIATAASRLPTPPVQLAPSEPATGTWETAVEEDPFEIPLAEKVDLLMRASQRMRTVPGLAFAEAGLDFFRRRSAFVSSEGAALTQSVTHSGAGVEAVAIGEGEMQRRSYPNSFRGHLRAAGYEHIRAIDLEGGAERAAREAVELLRAPDCPAEVTTVVLDSSQVILQVHESVGHAVELDRVLRMEEAYAGTSFVTPEDRGQLRYGSPLITITADATLPGGLGSFGWDDEGVPAQRVTVIEDGVFREFISSRETATMIGGDRSSGAMRADGWQNLPLIRMTNINLEPRDGSLEDLIEDTKDGLYLTTNQSWSIDDKRVNFQFGCEIAWRIQNGRLTQMYRNPTYTGVTTRFWGSCDAVGGPQSSELWGTPNCGKGQPGQVARVGHAAPPARFRDVQVGVR